MVFGLRLSAVAVQVGHGRCGGRVDPVVLAAATTRELTDSAGGGGGDIDDALTAGEQLPDQMPANPLVFFTTQLRCGYWRAQRSGRQYSGRLARIATDDSCC
ncbi:hypothetical protein ACFVFQ_35515 [Streptomyces sp. NPDC057743]|uniref:hypothetical protein n=1 Tax=Streptomyces sp. NPDC057743 TaxID=3346236 RepID=UPI0036CF64D4